MCTMKNYPIDDVFNLLGRENLLLQAKPQKDSSIEVDGYQVYTKSLRYALFYQKGTKCVCCGKEGTHFCLDASNSEDNLRRHFNLYADDGTLITKDHIKPKKLGGEDSIDNLQVMCETCNKAKGSSYDVPMLMYVARSVTNPEICYQFISKTDAVIFLLEKSHAFQKKYKQTNLIRKAFELEEALMNAIETKISYRNFLWSIEEGLYNGAANSK